MFICGKTRARAARLQDDQDDERWSIRSPVGWNSELEVLGIIKDSIDEDADDSWSDDKPCGVLDYDARTVNGTERWGPNRQRGDAGELDDGTETLLSTTTLRGSD